VKREYILNEGYLVEMEKDGDILIFVKPNLEEKNMIKENFDITDHDIASSIDEEELPRLDDEEKFFFIWKYPRNFMKKSDFEISSVGFFIRFTKIILITDYDFDYFRINKVKFRNNFDIILKFMEFTLKHYSAHLKITKAISKEVQSKIISSMENKYLLQIAGINLFYIILLLLLVLFLLKNKEKIFQIPKLLFVYAVLISIVFAYSISNLFESTLFFIKDLIIIIVIPTLVVFLFKKLESEKIVHIFINIMSIKIIASLLMFMTGLTLTQDENMLK
jgi:hypothetical protein